MSELICRVCLEENELVVYIYEEVEEFQMDLSTLLEICGNVKVNKTDAYPKYLCQECTNELLITAKFRKKCADMEERLIQLTSVPETSEEIDCVTVDQFSQQTETPPAEENIVVFKPKQCVDYAPEIVEFEKVSSDAEFEKIDAFILESSTEWNSDVNVASFQCDICGAVFMKAVSLQRHISRVHVPERVYCCDDCRHCYTKEDMYKAHKCTIKSSGNNQMNGSLFCLYCGKQFKAQFALNMHVRMHTGERPFGCSICAKKYKTKSALDSHMNLHTGLQQYKCSYCDRAFNDMSNMKRHERSHTGEKLHSCAICGKRFARVYLLQLHMHTHTGDRPYQCDECGQCFTQLGSLRNHQQIHTGVRLYVCSECPQRYVRHSQLTKHMSTKHAL